jgi:hypothetical protein
LAVTPATENNGGVKGEWWYNTQTDQLILRGTVEEILLNLRKERTKKLIKFVFERRMGNR